MTFSELSDAVRDARATVDRGDEVVQKIASLCVGRLRSSGVQRVTLNALKRELRDWDIHRACWKD